MENATAPAKDFSQGYRLLFVENVDKKDSSLDFTVHKGLGGFAIESSMARNWGIMDIQPGTPLLIKGTRGNADADLWGMNVIADIRVATLAEALRHMFIGKRVVITHEDNSQKDGTGVCVAIHKTPGDDPTSFDVELHDGHRYGIHAEQLTPTSVNGPMGYLLRGTRMVAVPGHRFTKGAHYMFGVSATGGYPTDVLVERALEVTDEGLRFPSSAELIPKDKLVAIGDHDGLYLMPGWLGAYCVLNRPLWDEYVARGVITLE